MVVSLIDVDSIIYIISYAYRDIPNTDPLLVINSCDSMIGRILKDTSATHYLGSFSDPSPFRHSVYKYAPYKGNRVQKPDWVVKWKPVIVNHCVSKWGFIVPTMPLEADDIICGVHYTLPDCEKIICSPDKDLKQIPGMHFNYKKPTDGIKQVNEEDAKYNFWEQVLIGDSVDNVKGVPGMGPKAFKLLKEGLLDWNDAMYSEAVKKAYVKYFEAHYGEEIYMQTLQTVHLMQPSHALWKRYEEYIDEITGNMIKCIPDKIDIFEDTNLEVLGWFKE